MKKNLNLNLTMSTGYRSSASPLPNHYVPAPSIRRLVNNYNYYLPSLPIRINTTLYTIPPFYLLPRYHSLTKNRNNFPNLRRSYADSTIFTKDNFNLKFAFRPIKKGALIFYFTDVFNEDFFIEQVKQYIDVGHLYSVICKINYGSGEVGRNRGEKETFSAVFTSNEISLYYSDGDITQITEFYNEIISQLNYTLEKDNIDKKEIIHVELIFKILDLKILSDLTYNPKSIVSESTKKNTLE